ncbi:MAG: hydroxymethylbilane synthase [Bacteroidetes bacterium]|nr:hydroxymethylbilane synthase [Bacteroidota bacterium]
MSNRTKQIIIGSRGSELALWQSNHIKDRLHALYPDHEIGIEIIRTTGDHILDSPLSMIGGKGLFTAELEEALIASRIDLAVHSLKDLPTQIHPQLAIAAISERADVRDAYVGSEGAKTIDSIPQGATIATGSLRRKAQLLAIRPDLNIVDVRGNVPTRVRKLRENHWAGMILAAAGLTRLGMQAEITQHIDPSIMLPAPGQGALAIEVRASDERMLSLLAPLNDPDTNLCVSAERVVLDRLGGGCQLPLGTYAHPVNDQFELTACFADLDGTSLVRASIRSEREGLIVAAENLAKQLLDSGAAEVIARLPSTARD